ncbi:ABC transporter permease [Mycolicibacterium goodii]|uniref:ABC transporter permease n=1 Tax=Mycolicibacterium goodii TaxID=134601 RepID=UPI001BDD4FF4|nr:ABC transporter permease [Mycolicibacterium goodii]MBU8813286.1 ABC transporter permease [Mycolicibacterium goodii]MBU8834546.1 ABC transporter permease [Mycolicibacterium goodii]
MRFYVGKRLGQAVLVLWAAYTVSFLLLSALPGDAVNNRIQNPEAQMTPEQAQVLIEYYGLDRPLWEQYVTSLAAVSRGDLGYSLTDGRTVTELLGSSMPSTLALTGLALVLGVVFSATIGLAANYAPWKRLRDTVASMPALFGSIPTFVVGILLLQFFSFGLHLIPASDNGSFVALLAPAVTLGILIAAPLAQVFTTSIRSARQQPFAHVLTARGAGEAYVFRRGVLRNSSMPVLTLLGLACGELIAGAVVTEAVFARRGIGSLTVGAVSTQDLPVLQGVVLIATLAYVTVNLVVDFAYPFIDPRVLVDGRTQQVTRARRRPTSAAANREATAVPSLRVPRRVPVEVSMP